MKRFLKHVVMYKYIKTSSTWKWVATLERVDTCRGLHFDWKPLIMNLLSRVFQCRCTVLGNTQHMKRPGGRSSPFSAPNGAPDPDVHARVETSRWQKTPQIQAHPHWICAGCYCTGAEHCVEAASTYPVSRVLLCAAMVPLEPSSESGAPPLPVFFSLVSFCGIVHSGASGCAVRYETVVGTVRL